jgi:hypothetical protein
VAKVLQILQHGTTFSRGRQRGTTHSLAGNPGNILAATGTGTAHGLLLAAKVLLTLRNCVDVLTSHKSRLNAELDGTSRQNRDIGATSVSLLVSMYIL